MPAVAGVGPIETFQTGAIPWVGRLFAGEPTPPASPPHPPICTPQKLVSDRQPGGGETYPLAPRPTHRHPPPSPDTTGLSRPDRPGTWTPRPSRTGCRAAHAPSPGAADGAGGAWRRAGRPIGRSPGWTCAATSKPSTG